MRLHNSPEFGATVGARRRELGLTMSQVVAGGGPSHAVLSRIEAGQPVAVTSATLRKLDNSLGWSPGTAWHALCSVDWTDGPEAVDGMERLRHVITRRRIELGYSHDDVASCGGPSDTTVSGMESGRRREFSRSTFRKFETALQWSPGSCEVVLAGGEPKPLATGNDPIAEKVITDAGPSRITVHLDSPFTARMSADEIEAVTLAATVAGLAAIQQFVSSQR